MLFTRISDKQLLWRSINTGKYKILTQLFANCCCNTIFGQFNQSTDAFEKKKKKVEGIREKRILIDHKKTKHTIPY